MKDIMEKIGELIKLVQYIEYNLVEATRLRRILLVFDKVNRVSDSVFHKAKKEADELGLQLANKTMGQIITTVKKYNVIDNDKVDILEDVLRKRNDLIHHYFKRKDFEKHSDNYPFLDNERGYLNNFYIQSDDLNDYLCNIIDELQEEYNGIE